MSRIIVLGAGVCGLAAGMLLRRDGHDVTVLERDADVVPDSIDEVWERWSRHGVAQFRQPHILLPRGRIVLEETLPDVELALRAAGATRFDMLDLMPPSIADRTPRVGDDRLWTTTGRRPVLERVLRSAAEAEPGLDIRTGVSVQDLVVRAYDGIPHVIGVRTDTGEEVYADLVVDAMGRRSQLPRWLDAAGTRPVYEEAEDTGFIYYTRHFRARDGQLPAFRAPISTLVGTFSLLTLPGDNDTWSVTVFISAGDTPLKRLRDPHLWTALIAQCPLHAHWLEGEPITGVEAMGGVLDRYRRFVVDGMPVATGIAPIGDAWACTNPSLGRGMSLGLRHVQLLREVIREHLEDPRRFAEEWSAVTETELTPWYRETVEEDRGRMAEFEALRHGLGPGRPQSSSAALLPVLRAAVAHDPDAFRAFVASRSCVTRLEEAFANQDFVEGIFRSRGAASVRPCRGQIVISCWSCSRARPPRSEARGERPELLIHSNCIRIGSQRHEQSVDSRWMSSSTRLMRSVQASAWHARPLTSCASRICVLPLREHEHGRSRTWLSAGTSSDSAAFARASTTALAGEGRAAGDRARVRRRRGAAYAS